MRFEIPKQARAEAVASLQRYCEENLQEPLGEMPAGMLLDFFLEEIGPAVYNQAVRDAQTRMQQQVVDLDGALYEEEMQYWVRRQSKRKPAGGVRR